MKYYLTKRALTEGIKVIESDNLKAKGDWLTEYHSSMFNERANIRYPIPLWTMKKPDWHETEELAFARAAMMYGKEMAALKRKIVRLEKMMRNHFKK